VGGLWEVVEVLGHGSPYASSLVSLSTGSNS
jgi:hypothetical protein